MTANEIILIAVVISEIIMRYKMEVELRKQIKYLNERIKQLEK